MAEREFNMELLIREIYKKPLLWNPKHLDYADKDIKNNAWEELCTVFDENYHNRSPERQMKMCATIRRKYKSLRDSYQREKNLQKYEAMCGEKNSKRKKYVYFDQLHFLSTGITRNRRILKKSSSKYEPTKAEASKNEKIEMAKERLPPKKTSKRIIDIETPYIANKLMTRQVVNVSSHVASPPSSDPKHKEEDTLFLLSLVKEIKKIPEDSRLAAKIDILKTIRRWQTSNESEQHSSTTTDVNQATTYDCPMCCKQFRTKDIQSRHLKTHIKKGMYTCGACSIAYRTMNELVLHLKVHKQPAESATSILVKEESIDDTFDEPSELKIVKCELSDSEGSHNE